MLVSQHWLDLLVVPECRGPIESLRDVLLVRVPIALVEAATVYHTVSLTTS